MRSDGDDSQDKSAAHAGGPGSLRLTDAAQAVDDLLSASLVPSSTGTTAASNGGKCGKDGKPPKAAAAKAKAKATCKATAKGKAKAKTKAAAATASDKAKQDAEMKKEAKGWGCSKCRYLGNGCAQCNYMHICVACPMALKVIEHDNGTQCYIFETSTKTIEHLRITYGCRRLSIG